MFGSVGGLVRVGGVGNFGYIIGMVRLWKCGRFGTCCRC